MSRWTPRLTTLRLEDAVALGMTVTAMDGDTSVGNTNAENAEHVKVMDRSLHDGFVLGDVLVQDFTFTLQMKNEAQTHATLARIRDFFQKTGSFASATSIDSTIWAFKASITMTNGSVTTVETFGIVEGEHSWAEAKPMHKIQGSFRCHSAPVRT